MYKWKIYPWTLLIINFSENDLNPHPLSTEFKLYTLEIIQNEIQSSGTLATTTDTATLNFE